MVEVILFDSNLKEIIFQVNQNIISSQSDSIIKFNTQHNLDPFMEYKLLNYNQYDRTGRVIRTLFFTNPKMFDFTMIGGNYEYTFSYKDVKDFYSDEPIYGIDYHSYLKSIKRDIKLSKLLQ